MISTERDARVMKLYEELLEIQQRLIPTGLHVFGRAAELKEKGDLLRLVGSFDRPEHGAASLPRLIAAGLKIDNAEQLLQETSTNETRELVNSILAESIQRFCEAGGDAAVEYLASEANVEREDTRATFRLMADVSAQ